MQSVNKFGYPDWPHCLVFVYIPEINDVMFVSGDPEVAPVFVRTLLPVFAQVFSGTLVYSVR